MCTEVLDASQYIFGSADDRLHFARELVSRLKEEGFLKKSKSKSHRCQIVLSDCISLPKSLCAAMLYLQSTPWLASFWRTNVPRCYRLIFAYSTSLSQGLRSQEGKPI